MRMMLKVQMDVGASNQAIREGRMPQVMEQALGQLQPEAAYFAPLDGKRTALVFFDLKDPSQIPVVAEPFFENLHASVEFIPVMTGEELQAGLQQVAGAR